MAETDLTDWLSIADAAARLGKSERTVRRLKRDKVIESRPRRQEGTPPVDVFNPEDVDRIAAETRQEPSPFVLPAVGNGNGHRRRMSTKNVLASTEPVPAGADLLHQFFALAVQALQSWPSRPSVPVATSGGHERLVSENPFLTLTEAAAARRVSERLVLKWMRTGKLDFEREPRSQWTKEDRGWRIRRKDLETL